ncbi:MAG: glycosyltransferase, partial [Pseudomonadota bacterium]
AQSLLAASYPDKTWRGLYLGRILTPAHEPAIVPDCLGLLFEAEAWTPTRPETAIVRHRHLIEGLLEPNARSIEDPVGGPADTVVRSLIKACASVPPDGETDALYVHVRRYIEENRGQSPARILAAHTPAMAELARMILTPTREEARALAGAPRSADFGKPFKVAVLLDPSKDNGTSDDRIARSLWPEGQIALEHPPATARDLQNRMSGCQSDASYFDPAGSTPTFPQQTRTNETTKPRVAVITRTKNRPVLLRRAAASVASQTQSDLIWTVVNDGGDAGDVVDIMADIAIDPRRMRLVSHNKSLGMEAASNSGIMACDSDYIVIHDDDDSWRPEFLERTLAFLDSPAGARYGGVVSHSLYVSEEVQGDRVIEHEERPYNDWVRNVQLSEMACGNFFPPIAFVFRRAVWERVGGFNEALPVLGDWFFNLEVLLDDDIAVLPEPLARYHHRDRGDANATLYANSVIGGVSKHEEFAAVARNAFLRRHGDRAGVAASFALGYAVNDLRGRIGKQEKPRAAPPAQTSGGTDDRLWCVAELNAARKRRRPWHVKKPPALPADAGWTALVDRLRSAAATLRTPPDFDEANYLRINPDVEAAVAAGRVASGYIHYVLHGRPEGRARQTRS